MSENLKPFFIGLLKRYLQFTIKNFIKLNSFGQLAKIKCSPLSEFLKCCPLKQFVCWAATVKLAANWPNHQTNCSQDVPGIMVFSWLAVLQQLPSCSKCMRH